MNKTLKQYLELYQPTYEALVEEFGEEVHRELNQMIEVGMIEAVEIYRFTMSDPTDRLVNEIISRTCEVFNVPRHKLISKIRKRPIPQVRQVLGNYFHEHLGLTLTKAGEYLWLNHCTVLHGNRQVANAATDFVLRDVLKKFNDEVINAPTETTKS